MDGGVAHGVEDMDWNVPGPVREPGEAEPDLVRSGLGKFWGECQRFGTLFSVVVVEIPGAEIGWEKRGCFPFAHRFCILIIENHAMERGEGERDSGFQGGRRLFFRQFGDPGFAVAEFCEPVFQGLEFLFGIGNRAGLDLDSAADFGFDGERLSDPGNDVVGVIGEGARGSEDAGEGVIVPLRDGIEFVVMAAGAAEGLAEERLAEGVDLFIDHVEPEALFVLFLVNGGADGEESRGAQLACPAVSVGRWEQVAGDLFPDENIKRPVGVVGFHHVIPVAPGVFEEQGASAAAGFGKACHVEPVAAPCLAELRGGEERVCKVGERLPGICCSGDLVELLQSRGQAGQLQAQAPG